MLCVSQRHTAGTDEVTSLNAVLGSLFWQGRLVPVVGKPAESPRGGRR